MRFSKFLITIIFLIVGHHHYSQCSNLSVAAGTNADLVTETLYEENFSGQDDKGAFGSNIDVTGCTWTVDVSSATLSNNDEF